MSQQPPVRILLISVAPEGRNHLQEQINRTNVAADIHMVSSFAEMSGQLGTPCRYDAYDAAFLDNTLANGKGVANVQAARNLLRRDITLVVYTDDATSLDIHAYYDAGADEILGRGAGPLQILSAMIKSQRATSRRRYKRAWTRSQSSYVKDISARLDSALSRRKNVPAKDLSAVTDAQHI